LNNENRFGIFFYRIKEKQKEMNETKSIPKDPGSINSEKNERK